MNQLNFTLTEAKRQRVYHKLAREFDNRAQHEQDETKRQILLIKADMYRRWAEDIAG